MPMLTEPTLEKLQALRLDAFAAAWRAQQQDPALAAVPFDERPPGRGRMARPRKPAAGDRPAGGEAAPEPSLRRGHRPRGPPRTRQGTPAPTRHLPLGPRPPQCPDQRDDGHGEELPRLRPRAAGVPQGLPRPLPPRPPALRGTYPRPRRRQLHPPPRPLRPDRRPRPG